ncbi:hypothetical protein ACJMK2_035028 [Sinanodonta woodiana]|uniref:Kazal-like domain-containing protein n=1 Tax=Sinanodonta woodiana TaxID=1069815 RepID=A0ABD3WWY5_SINWO
MRLVVLLALFLLLNVTLAAKSKRKERIRTKRIDRENIPTAVEGGTGNAIGIQQAANSQVVSNPCNNKQCSRGETCVLDEGVPQCICRGPCPEESNPVYQVCSTKNNTYPSECDLDRDHCLCKHEKPDCSVPGARRVHLDYFGPCIKVTECPAEEFQDFPVRMRDWLFVVMQELAKRQELDEYQGMLESAQHDEVHTDAVIWKFCDLDVHPTDRSVTRRELLYVIASLKSMEHCLIPFLSMCDKNEDGNIDLVEWGTCLGIDQESISNKCKDIHAKSKKQ